jgi:hypothetical protein
LVDEGIADVDPNLDADVVGLTVITGTAPRAYELAAGFRRRGIPVVLGGPHVTLVPDDAQPHADSVVVGYAEDSWPELLRDLAGSRLRSRYVQQPGLSLANRPFPRRDLLPARRYLTTNVFEATRGCIHNCDFCVCRPRGPRYQKPVEDIADIRQHGTKAIFVDLNLIADREYPARLFGADPAADPVCDLSTVLLADDLPLLKLPPGRVPRPPARVQVDRRRQSSRRGKVFNKPAHFARVVSLLHHHGIGVNCFVFGMDRHARYTSRPLRSQARIDLLASPSSRPFRTALPWLERDDGS